MYITVLEFLLLKPELLHFKLIFSRALQSSRGGQSVTLVRNSLVIFGGQDAKRSMLNDLHILDLETMTWDEFDAQ